MVIKITLDEKKPVDQEIIRWLLESGVSPRQRATFVKFKLIECMRQVMRSDSAPLKPDAIHSKKANGELDQLLSSAVGSY